MFLLVKLHIDMGLEAVLPGPQNAFYVMLCYVMLSYERMEHLGLWSLEDRCIKQSGPTASVHPCSVSRSSVISFDSIHQ